MIIGHIRLACFRVLYVYVLILQLLHTPILVTCDACLPDTLTSGVLLLLHCLVEHTSPGI